MIYDITLPISPTLAVWPGDPPVARVDSGDRVRISRWSMGSHTGTHVDAPCHFSAGPGTVDLMNPAVLLGPCRVLDFPDVARITADDLRRHPLDGIRRVLLKTHNARRWEEDPATFDPEFVALDATAARYLLTVGITLVGVDGLSVEFYGGNGEVHELLLGAGVIVLEGLRLAAVPPGDYQLICAPLKLAGADGAPARVFLIGED